MNSPEIPEISVVTPVFNEQDNVPRLIREIREAMQSTGRSWEIVAVNDGSSDLTLSRLLEERERDARVKIVDLSRNFGHQKALLAGLTHASGQIIACLDGDLQDPPSCIPEMIALLDKERADVVYAVRRKRKEAAAKRTAYWMAYRFMRWIMEIDLPLDSGDFSVMRRPVLDAVLRMPEQSLFLRGLRAWVGFRQVPFEYERAARAEGEAKYSWRDLFKLAYNGIFSFTKVPIRFLGFVGMGAILISICYAVFLGIALLTGSNIPKGFPTIIFAILFFSGVQLLALRILGAYMHRIYDEVRGRPLFLVRTFYHAPADTAGPTSPDSP